MNYDRNQFEKSLHSEIEFEQISERNSKTRKIEKLKNQNKIRKSFEIQRFSYRFRRSGNPISNVHKRN